MVAATRTEIGGSPWAIDDEPCRLRRWGTDTVYPFPQDAGIIGSTEGCWLQLQDDKERVSRQHARLSNDGGRWLASDMQSKNGIYEDGSRRTVVHLAPGVELGIGGFTLIAESLKLINLREAVSRLLGWSEDRREAVDLALRSLRMAATRRESLHICGEGALVSVAHFLHQCTLGEARPFVVCDPRRRRSDSSARGARNYDSGVEALEAAAGGTLCVWQSRQPEDFNQVLEAWRKPTSRVQLVVCTHAPLPSDPLLASQLVIPPLAERSNEINRIIDAYALDASLELGATLTEVDREWVRRHEAATLPSIEKATRRLVALRKASGHITRAAAMLGMTYSALTEYFNRRTFDYTLSDENDN